MKHFKVFDGDKLVHEMEAPNITIMVRDMIANLNSGEIKFYTESRATIREMLPFNQSILYTVLEVTKQPVSMMDVVCEHCKSFERCRDGNGTLFENAYHEQCIRKCFEITCSGDPIGQTMSEDGRTAAVAIANKMNDLGMSTKITSRDQDFVIKAHLPGNTTFEYNVTKVW